MLGEGDIIEFKGNEITICYSTTIDDDNYIIGARAEDKIIYEIYKYKYENDKLMVCKIEDSDEITSIFGKFFNEEIEKNGIPEELQNILDNLE